MFCKPGPPAVLYPPGWHHVPLVKRRQSPRTSGSGSYHDESLVRLYAQVFPFYLCLLPSGHSCDCSSSRFLFPLPSLSVCYPYGYPYFGRFAILTAIYTPSPLFLRLYPLPQLSGLRCCSVPTALSLTGLVSQERLWIQNPSLYLDSYRRMDGTTIEASGNREGTKLSLAVRLLSCPSGNLGWSQWISSLVQVRRSCPVVVAAMSGVH